MAQQNRPTLQAGRKASNGEGGYGVVRSIVVLLAPLRGWFDVGGAEEIRTPDLRLAKAALSQLSYGPSGT